MNILEAAKTCNVELQQIGQLYRAFCPFHKDKKNPNFILYPETNSFFCFACGEGGGVVRFLRKMGYKGNLVDLIFKTKRNLDIANSDFRITAAKKIAELANHFFKTHPAQSDKLMVVLEEIDARLISDLTLPYKDAMGLFKKFQQTYNELMTQHAHKHEKLVVHGGK